MNLRHFLLAVTLTTASTAAAAQIPLAEYAQRRAALAARLQDGVLLALGSPAVAWLK